MNKYSKKVIYIAAIVFIFALSSIVYLYPIQKKGFPPGGEFISLITARNWATSGQYISESANGTILSSSNVLESGSETAILNPLTPIIYGRIFKTYDANLELPMFFSIILFAISNVLLFVLATRLFNLKIGLLCGITSSFLPVMVLGAIQPGFYEWGLLFFTIALTFFFWSKDSKPKYSQLILASIFFALAALARNAFAVSFIPFVIFELYRNRSVKRLVAIVLPFIVLFGLTLTQYSWLGMENGYFSKTKSPFIQIGHLFPDSYTETYKKADYINSLRESGEYDRTNTAFLKKYGFPVSTKDTLNSYFDSAKFYLSETFKFTNLGGSLTILLMLIGGAYLYKNKRWLLTVFGLWVVVTYLSLIYFQTSNWDHFIELAFPISLMCSLGIITIINKIKDLELNKFIKTSFSVALGLLFVLNLVQANKWSLFDYYRSSVMEQTVEISQSINNLGLDPKKESIAIGIHPNAVYIANYLTDLNFTYFNEKTITNFGIEELRKAFKDYKITRFTGFTQELSKKIKEITKLDSI